MENNSIKTIIISIILISIGLGGCSSIRNASCFDRNYPVPYILSGYSQYESQDRTFRIGLLDQSKSIRLPDSLRGNKLEGFFHGDIMLNAKQEVCGIEAGFLLLDEKEKKHTYHDYIYYCHKNPKRKKFHKKIMSFLEEKVKELKFEYHLMREIPLSELQKDTLYPVLIKFRFTTSSEDVIRRNIEKRDSLLRRLNEELESSQ